MKASLAEFGRKELQRNSHRKKKPEPSAPTIPRWTTDEVKQAMQEGWRINTKTHPGWRKPLMRIESCNVNFFLHDWQAVYHVLNLAKHHKLHRDAVRIVYEI